MLHAKHMQGHPPRINVGDGKASAAELSQNRVSTSGVTPNKPPLEVSKVLSLVFSDGREDEQICSDQKQLEVLRALFKACSSSDSTRVVGALLEGFGSTGELLVCSAAAIECEVRTGPLCKLFDRRSNVFLSIFFSVAHLADDAPFSVFLFFPEKRVVARGINDIPWHMVV